MTTEHLRGEIGGGACLSIVYTLKRRKIEELQVNIC
jgi:hypothetical protein